MTFALSLIPLLSLWGFFWWLSSPKPVKRSGNVVDLAEWKKRRAA